MATQRLVAPVVGVALLSMLLLTVAVQVEAVREHEYPAPATQDDALYVRSGSALRRLAGAFNPLAADVYWVRTIQYYGGAKRRLAAQRLTPPPPPMLASVESDDYRDLYPLLDITTSLDPRFNIAYRFGAVFLAEPYPGGPGRPDLAVTLLEKGLRDRPDKWEYMQDIGFVHYWYLHDYAAAASWFDRGGKVPGAPWWLQSLAATTLEKGGDRRSSRVMWAAIGQTAENDWLRNDAERRLAQFRALDDLDALQRVVDDVGRRLGQSPADWGALVRARAVRGVPLDPTGTPYQLTPEGRVRMSPSSSLLPLPVEPAQADTRPPS